MATILNVNPATTQQPASVDYQPVSFQLTREQEGLWIEWKLSPVGVSYNTCVQLTLQGPLDTARFSQAIADVVAQFELLRGYCVEENGQPFFHLSEETYALEVIDISDGDRPESNALRNKALALLTRRRDAAIDLRKFPLIRSALIKTATNHYYFVGVVPHIISDGYSAVFVLKAISIAYREGRTGLADAFGRDKKDWRDYLARRAEQSAESQVEAIEHWQAVLTGAEHITPVCAPDDSQGVVDIRGRRHFFSLGAEQVQRFTRLARARKTSLFSILAALYATLLYRQTSQQDLVIVFPVNTRPAGYRDAFGFFVNMMPLRVDLSGNPSFTELVDQIGRRRRLDKKHQHLPALDIIKAKRESMPGFDGRLCNVSMAQTVSRFQGLEIPGVVCTALDNDWINVRDDLSLMYEVSEQLIGFWLEYRESSFSNTQIEAMAQHFLTIAAAVDQDPDVGIASIELVSPTEREALLTLGTGAELAVDHLSYGTLFNRSVEAHGDEVALRYHDQTMTYKQLDTLSADLAVQMAAQMAAQMAQTGGPVAVLLQRSPAQLVTVLAALRAGIAYVPLDPDQGAIRIEQILDEIRPGCLVCEHQALDEFAKDWRDIHLDLQLDRQLDQQLDQQTGRETPASPLNEVTGSTSAYIIYTSGSSGRPKGVQVSHAAMLQRIAWLTSEFHLEPGEAVLHNTNYAFDVSVAEIFWPLAMGATLVLSDANLARDPRYLRQLIADEKITTACMVASALQMLLPEPAEREQLSSLQRLLCAGEALPLALTKQFFRLTQARLFNIYGPTEATIYATWKEIGTTDLSVTIGKPVANTSLAVVNDALRIQPLGVAGELCLSGAGLADGYVAQNSLTAGKFPEGVIDGGRWYRTGDRARLLASGEVEYLGRSDGQIKLRGYRIELGEIEHVLRMQKLVEDAAVVVRSTGEPASNQQLDAYVAAGPGFVLAAKNRNHPLHTSNWRTTLAALLPCYMMPNTLSWVAILPRLASGKLDQTALPGLVAKQADVRIPPSSADERILAGIWARVLNLPVTEIGLHNNFFELGGDSLMLIALATKAEEAGLYIDVHELFEYPTIAQAASRARKSPRLLINQAPVQGTFPTLPRHRKFFQDSFAHPEHWNRSFLLRFDRHIVAEALQQSLQAVIRHHDGLRLSFHGDGTMFTNHGATQVSPSIETIDLTGIATIQRQDLMLAKMNEANASLRLDVPLLLRIMLFEDERTSTLVLILHHLLIDMRSCHILLEDLLSGYQASVSHRPIRLPGKTTSVGEWSEQLSRLVDENWQVEEIPFWSAQLDRVGHSLPTDRRPTDWTIDAEPIEADYRFEELDLSGHHTQLLTRVLCQELNMGVHEILLAGFSEMFKGWSNASHLVVNTCGIGRDHLIDGVNLTRTVGELNTVFPLAIDLRTGNALQTVKTSFQSMPAKGLHYPMLRYLGKHAALNKTEPDVFFNYVSRLDSSLEKGLGVTIEMAPGGVQSSNPENRACYALYLEAFIQNDQLRLHLGYDAGRFSKTSIEHALSGWAKALIDMLKNNAATPTSSVGLESL